MLAWGLCGADANISIPSINQMTGDLRPAGNNAEHRGQKRHALAYSAPVDQAWGKADTHRLRLGPIRDIRRPAVLRFERTAADWYAVKVRVGALVMRDR